MPSHNNSKQIQPVKRSRSTAGTKGGDTLTERLAYYSVVRVLRSDQTDALGVSGCTGVVMGISDSGSQLRYGVLIGEEAYMVDSSDVSPTGEILSREVFYDGTSISVAPQRYADDA